MQISVTPFQGMVFNDFQGPSECHGHGLSAKWALSVEGFGQYLQTEVPSKSQAKNNERQLIRSF